jgi:uncharacterized protein
MTEQKEVLTFPTDYPIKVVGKRTANLRARVDAVVVSHVPDLDHALTTERDSSNANFVSISYTIRATSREQIVALATALQATEDVIMLI